MFWTTDQAISFRGHLLFHIWLAGSTLRDQDRQTREEKESYDIVIIPRYKSNVKAPGANLASQYNK
jgi:hypothetical protein